MELDRSSIEKHDFPLKRRGYDPEAVERHLAALADAVERRSERPESLATAASDRVRGILDAAERGAAELAREARTERSRILDEAHAEAGRHLQRVAAATEAMLERTAVLEQELEALLDAVRSSATRLRDELQALGGTADELREPQAPPASPAAAPSDDDGARLVALNMALNGTPREETQRYLAEHFGAHDVDGLLDDVYVRAGQ